MMTTHDQPIPNQRCITDALLKQAKECCNSNLPKMRLATWALLMFPVSSCKNWSHRQLHGKGNNPLIIPSIMNAQDITTDVSHIDIPNEPGYYQLLYLGIKITVMRSLRYNGWINAKEICRIHKNKKGNPKDVNDWLVNKGTIKLLNDFTQANRLTTCRTLIHSSNRIIAGTYIHKDLLINLLVWCNSALATQISPVINMINQQSNLPALTTLANQLSQQQTRIDLLQDQVSRIPEAITTIINNTIESSNNPLDQNVIMIVNRNTDTGHQYTVHRRQQISRPALIQDLDEACPSYAIMIEFNTSYAVRAWKIVKRELVNQGKIQMHVGGFIELLDDFTIQDLINTTERLHTKWLTQIQQGTAVVSGLVANQINWWYQLIWVVGFGLCMNQFANLWHLLQKLISPISNRSTASSDHIILQHCTWIARHHYFERPTTSRSSNASILPTSLLLTEPSLTSRLTSATRFLNCCIIARIIPTSRSSYLVILRLGWSASSWAITYPKTTLKSLPKESSVVGTSRCHLSDWIKLEPELSWICLVLVCQSNTWSCIIWTWSTTSD